MENLKGYVKRYWFLYTIAIICMVISIFLDAAAPQITRMIIDDVIVGRRLNLLMQLLLGLIGIGAARAVLQYIKEFTFDKVGARIGCSLRKNLFGHIQTLSMGYFDRHNTGELMARVKDDVDRVWDALGFIGMLIIECTVHTVIIVTCMFSISPVLTLIPLAIMPVIAFLAVKMEGRLGKVYDEISEETAKLNTVAQENLAGVRTVKAFAREEFEIQKFKKHNKEYYELNMRQARDLAAFQPMISFLTKLLVMAVLVVGGIMVIKGKITIGQLGAFTEYSTNITWPMEMVGWLSNGFAAAMASNRKIKRIMKEEPDISNPEEPTELPTVRGELEFRHVDFALNGTDILKDINFKLEPGRMVGIMGMTGSGKSSVVNLIKRFYDPDGGAILLDGTDIRTLKLSRLRGNVSVVMQDVFLFSDTVSENIKTGKKAETNLETVLEAARYAKAHRFIDRLSGKYETVIGERGVGLSGGQKQRISIARALAKHAPILILDDATSALDMETESEIQKKLSEITDVSKIIIGHRISAVRHADEILIFHQGRIVERGTHEELMRQGGEYYRTYQVQYGDYKPAGEGEESGLTEGAGDSSPAERNEESSLAEGAEGNEESSLAEGNEESSLAEGNKESSLAEGTERNKESSLAEGNKESSLAEGTERNKESSPAEGAEGNEESSPAEKNEKRGEATSCR